MSVCAQPDQSVNTEVAPQMEEVSNLISKEQALRQLLSQLERVIVAFSGGVDSTYLAYVANEVLGVEAVCITGESASLSGYQRDGVKAIVERLNLNHEVITTEELDNPQYVANNGTRCYFCKDELYGRLEAVASARQIEFILDGSTVDDLGDYRPGRQAATEHSVRSPLIEVGLSKAEIRELSKRADLPTWDKPASPCLSSRIAYGTTVTIERLAKVDRGEEILREFGFKEFRVRHHDNLVRLEIASSEMERILDKRVVEQLASRFRELGFKFVTLDLNGFRSGSMNEVLSAPVSLVRS